MAGVLIVDDEPVMRELIEVTLEDAGHSVESGRAALERLAQHAYDLIVCDLHMPDRDGPAVYRAIERRAPPPPAVPFLPGAAPAGPDEGVPQHPPAPAPGTARCNPAPPG